jgi:hypothetical protein
VRETLETSSSKQRLLVDCSEMQDYDLEARHAFVELMAKHRSQLSAIAILTEKKLWHMVVSAMALASRTEMRAFADATETDQWLQGKARV